MSAGPEHAGAILLAPSNAVVVADSLQAALDAAERVEIDYEPLPAVTDPVAALEASAPLAEPPWGDNLALSVKAVKGDPDGAFADAAVVVEDEFATQRYVAAPLDPRRSPASRLAFEARPVLGGGHFHVIAKSGVESRQRPISDGKGDFRH